MGGSALKGQVSTTAFWPETREFADKTPLQFNMEFKHTQKNVYLVFFVYPKIYAICLEIPEKGVPVQGHSQNYRCWRPGLP